jgi:hypothetical protein
MKNLAADIAAEGAIYDAPLVMRHDDLYVVFDGNRRVSCLKLLLDPARAPTRDLQGYFQELRANAGEELPVSLTCQVEDDRVKIDNILYRRHTGSQRGVGQLGWNDRAKLNFVERTGQGGGINVAAEVERFLQAEGRLPQGNIPWSTLTRLLSSEEFRNRAGFSTTGRRFRLTHDHGAVADALHRIASDLRAASSRSVISGTMRGNALISINFSKKAFYRMPTSGSKSRLNPMAFRAGRDGPHLHHDHRRPPSSQTMHRISNGSGRSSG